MSDETLEAEEAGNAGGGKSRIADIIRKADRNTILALQGIVDIAADYFKPLHHISDALEKLVEIDIKAEKIANIGRHKDEERKESAVANLAAQGVAGFVEHLETHLQENGKKYIEDFEKHVNAISETVAKHVPNDLQERMESGGAFLKNILNGNDRAKQTIEVG
jgi:uncharacterized protein YicC (UPF0701 family)